MNRILFAAAVVAAWLVLRPLLRVGLAALFAGSVGKQALARQPDTIHLVAAGSDVWRSRARADRAAGQLKALGYADAGTWTVPEMPGLVLWLLVSPAEYATAAIYEHPKAGHWCEVFFRCQDGTSATFSSARPTGLKDRPGHRLVRIPGADADKIVELADEQRPTAPLLPVSVSDAPRRFEEAYAEAVAYRKSVGISRSEVVNVAQKRAA